MTLPPEGDPTAEPELGAAAGAAAAAGDITHHRRETLPPEGDPTAELELGAAGAAVEGDITYHRRELRLTIVQRWMFFGLAWLVVIAFYGVLFYLLMKGPAGPDGYRIYVTELGIVAVIPTAILLRLAGMAAPKGEQQGMDVPLASTEVVREALKSVVELAKLK